MRLWNNTGKQTKAAKVRGQTGGKKCSFHLRKNEANLLALLHWQQRVN